MTKTTHTVTLPNGKKAQRVSQGRRYTHVVISRETEASRTQAIAYDVKQAAEYRVLATDRARFEGATAPGPAPPRADAPVVARSQVLVARSQVQAVLRHLRGVAGGHLSSAVWHDDSAASHRTRSLRDWSAVSWASRLDLAQKAAAVHTYDGRYETKVLAVDAAITKDVKKRTVAQEIPEMTAPARALFDKLAAARSSHAITELPEGFTELAALDLACVNTYGDTKYLGVTRHGYNIVKSIKGLADGTLVAKKVEA